MHRIFISGAITPTGPSNHAIEYLTNVRTGVQAATSLMLAGFVTYCPMIDFQLFLGLYPGEEIREEVIRGYALSFVEHWAEAILVLPGWEKSQGVKKEVSAAVRCHIPVFYDEMDMTKYFQVEDLTHNANILIAAYGPKRVSCGAGGFVGLRARP